MRKFLGALFGIALILGGGIWFLLLRHTPQPEARDEVPAFASIPAPTGSLMRYQDTQMPLRLLRWLPPTLDGHQVAQVITQNNRQRVGLFQAGQFQQCLSVPAPEGLPPNIFHFAELRDALITQNCAVLLYQPDRSGSSELPFVIAMDLDTQQVRWTHRATGTRLKLVQTARESAVLLFGSSGPISRLPLALQRGERLSPTGQRSSAQSLGLPEDLHEISDLIPLGPQSIAVAHPGGLSIYQEGKGWRHQEAPPPPAWSFRDASPTLAAGKKRWWQPRPGCLIPIQPDGTPGTPLLCQDFGFPESNQQDASLLQLMGTDSEGNLWFRLATPIAPTSKAAEDSAPDAPSSLTADELLAYSSRGLDRLYRWTPGSHAIIQIDWTKTWAGHALPSGFSRPVIPLGLNPERGGFLLASSLEGWWIPFSAFAPQPK